MKYGFRWRMFWKDPDGTRREMFRMPLKKTRFMLDLVWERWRYGPGNYRMLYLVLPGIVNIEDHNWSDPRRKNGRNR